MNKTELVAAIAEKTELSKKDAEKALKAFTDVVAEELKKGEKIQLVGFGTFEVAERPAREGRNPSTGKAISSRLVRHLRIQLTLNCQNAERMITSQGCISGLGMFCLLR